MLKERASSIISTYTADVSGMCSALYEFGGMCIIHDASGCNSTYNTHDEPRWYDMDSMVYISALTEIEAIMGDDNKIIGDIVSAVRDLKPKFVALTASPISSAVGTDMDAIAQEVSRQTGIAAFAVGGTGMKSYVSGAGDAFLKLLTVFAEDVPKSERMSVNVLGTTPLDFSVNGYTDDLYAFFAEQGIEVRAKLGMGGKLSDVQNAASAWVNLVVSSSGINAAKWMYDTFSIPYVAVMPQKDFQTETVDALKDAAADKKCRILTENDEKSDIVIIADAVVGGTIAAMAKKKFDASIRVICPPDTEEVLLKNGMKTIVGENWLRGELKTAKKIIADPLFKPICRDGAEFISFPHEAFSGRIYREQIPNLFK